MDKIKQLREMFGGHGIDGFILPSQDEYLGEYVPECFRRLEWLTGFTGSSGVVLILKEQAAFFTDGRYTTQAKQQIGDDIEIFNVADKKPQEWLKENLENGEVGYCSWLHTQGNINDYKEVGIQLKAVENLIDLIWQARPSVSSDKYLHYNIKYSGQYSENKIKNLATFLKEGEVDAVVLTASDSICWLLNIRGNDVPNTPLVLSYAIAFSDGKVALYAAPEKFDDKIISQLDKGIKIFPVSELEKNIGYLSKKKVLIDPKTANSWFFDVLETAGAEIIQDSDPCQLPKAIKNDIEIEGMKNVHIVDGAALTKFLCWLDQNIGNTTINEVSASDRLEEFRRETGFLKDLSFPAISGYASNGAIVHYKANAETCLELKPESIYLIDSGGQYLGGTTDVTRTVALGEPTPEQKKNFTLVLKGHIAIARAEFDRDTTGADLDPLARQYLNAEGLDYDHGTGHGVGSYLGVHEGPQGISRRSMQVFYPGMVVSNEPGYYKECEYGIRIESLVLVVEKGKKLGFETITMAPIDLNLVDTSLLTEEEKQWLNEYHEIVREKVLHLLDDKTKDWLIEKTKPLG